MKTLLGRDRGAFAVHWSVLMKWPFPALAILFASACTYDWTVGPAGSVGTPEAGAGDGAVKDAAGDRNGQCDGLEGQLNLAHAAILTCSVACDDTLLDPFYNPEPVMPTRARKPARVVEKPTHYKICCISLYTEDIERLDNVASKIEGRTICALGDAAAMPVRSFVKHFRAEFEHYIQHGRSVVDTAHAAAAA